MLTNKINNDEKKLVKINFYLNCKNYITKFKLVMTKKLPIIYHFSRNSLFVISLLIILSSCKSLITKPEIIPKKESQEEYLEKIYSTGKPQKLREIFNHYSKFDFLKKYKNYWI